MIALGVLGAVAGAILGSFIATIIIRWPQGRSVASGRSTCDGCGRALGATDLVPILSAVLLRGRCRTCSAKIDPIHLQVELACAAIGGFSLGLAPGPEGAALALLGWLLVPLVMLDWRHFWLPDRLTLALAASGLAVGHLATSVSLPDQAIGGALGLLSLWVMGAGFARLRGKRGLGGGDAKLLGAIGCWVGWQALPFVLLLAAGGSLAVILATRSYRDATRKYPFGVALGMSGWMVAAVSLVGLL